MGRSRPDYLPMPAEYADEFGRAPDRLVPRGGGKIASYRKPVDLNAVAELGLSVLPGSGDAIAIREGRKNFQDMGRSIEAGDYGKAASDAIMGGYEYLSAAPGIGAVLPSIGGVIRAYHASPYEFSTFKINQDTARTGEGAQAYGPGGYMAGNKETAKRYKEQVPYQAIVRKFQDLLPDDAEFEDVMDLVGTGHFSPDQDRVISALAEDDWLGFDYPSQAITAAYRDLDNFDPSDKLREAVKGSGRMYTIDIDANPEDFLQYDAPLSDQPEFVAAALKKIASGSSRAAKLVSDMLRNPRASGGDIVARARKIAPDFFDDLQKSGVAGVQYKDALSRGKDDGTYNYVVFDDALIDIKDRDPFSRGGRLPDYQPMPEEFSEPFLGKSGEAIGYRRPDDPSVVRYLPQTPATPKTASYIKSPQLPIDIDAAVRASVMPSPSDPNYLSVRAAPMPTARAAPATAREALTSALSGLPGNAAQTIAGGPGSELPMDLGMVDIAPFAGGVAMGDDWLANPDYINSLGVAMTAVGAPGIVAKGAKRALRSGAKLVDDVLNPSIVDDIARTPKPKRSKGAKTSTRSVGRGIADQTDKIPGEVSQLRGMTNEQLAEYRRGGLLPHLRVPVDSIAFNTPQKPLLVKDMTQANAERQTEGLSVLEMDHADAVYSEDAWKIFERRMNGTHDAKKVPIDDAVAPPFNLIKKLQNPKALEDEIASLTPAQQQMANEGLEISRKFGDEYRAGNVTPDVTGELFLWSYLSRMQSAFPQEAAFLDAVGEGVAPYIAAAYRGEFDDAVLESYLNWAKTVFPEGVPGRSNTSNLNSFGSHFLKKMSEPTASGESKLARLHDMMSNPEMSGPEIRRQFYSMVEKPGIDNKVLSFTLLVSGRPDMMVMDRIQIRNAWDDGRYNGENIYDGFSDAAGAPATGSGLQAELSGPKGLARYEAIERGLNDVLPGVYERLGRPGEGSVGRYHWESWVGASNQEVGHGSLDVMLNKIAGKNAPEADVPSREGRFHQYEYGAEYLRPPGRRGVYKYKTSDGTPYYFDPVDFKKMISDIRSDKDRSKPKFGVVPKGFKISQADRAFYEMPGVDREALDKLIKERGRARP